MGSSFDDFLREEGVFEETMTQAVKRVSAWQIADATEKQGSSKIEVAARGKVPMKKGISKPKQIRLLKEELNRSLKEWRFLAERLKRLAMELGRLEKEL